MSNSDEVLQAWRTRLELRPVTLGNGEVILIQPVTLEVLVANGTIPLPIFLDSQEAAKQRQRKKSAGIDEDFLKMLPGVNAVVMAAAAVPRVAEVEALDEGVISLDRLSLVDRLLIYEEASGAARALRSFRGEPDGGADVAPDGDDVPPAAE